ncbi:MAG: hypothetical protein KF861_15445, partial [Planctomycetaceae bacterium]|nr:hypothetical protein [Planctomycetaceae bacterium]
IVAAQALTVLAAPLMAGTLWWLTSQRSLMGDHVNGPGSHLLAGVGFLLLLGMAYRLVTVEIPRGLETLRAKPQVTWNLPRSPELSVIPSFSECPAREYPSRASM